MQIAYGIKWKRFCIVYSVVPLYVVAMFLFFFSSFAKLHFNTAIDQWQRRRVFMHVLIYFPMKESGTRAQHIYHMDEDINVFALRARFRPR